MLFVTSCQEPLTCWASVPPEKPKDSESTRVTHGEEPLCARFTHSSESLKRLSPVNVPLPVSRSSDVQPPSTVASYPSCAALLSARNVSTSLRRVTET